MSKVRLKTGPKTKKNTAPLKLKRAKPVKTLERQLKQGMKSC